MSAGSGIRHAEYNLEAGPTTLFQIRIQPNQAGGQPYCGGQPFPRATGRGNS